MSHASMSNLNFGFQLDVVYKDLKLHRGTTSDILADSEVRPKRTYVSGVALGTQVVGYTGDPGNNPVVKES